MYSRYSFKDNFTPKTIQLIGRAIIFNISSNEYCLEDFLDFKIDASDIEFVGRNIKMKIEGVVFECDLLIQTTQIKKYIIKTKVGEC